MSNQQDPTPNRPRNPNDAGNDPKSDFPRNPPAPDDGRTPEEREQDERDRQTEGDISGVGGADAPVNPNG